MVQKRIPDPPSSFEVTGDADIDGKLTVRSARVHTGGLIPSRHDGFVAEQGFAGMDVQATQSTDVLTPEHASIAGNRLITAQNFTELGFFDISSPGSIASIGTFSPPSMDNVGPIDVSRGIAAVIDTNEPSVIMVDVSTFSGASELDAANLQASATGRVLLDGSTLYSWGGDYLESFSIDATGSLSAEDSINDSDYNNDSVFVSLGDYLVGYTGTNPYYATTVDVSDPANMTVADQLQLPSGVGHMVAGEDFVWAVERGGGNITAVSIADDGSITQGAQFTPSNINLADYSQMYGNVLYSANSGDDTLTAIDLSDPSRPRELSNVATNSGATWVGVGNGAVYVTAPFDNTIEVFY